MQLLLALASLLLPVWASRRFAPPLLLPLVLVPVGTVCLWAIGAVLLVFATMDFQGGVLTTAAPDWADGLVFISFFTALVPLFVFGVVTLGGVAASVVVLKRSLPVLRAQGRLPRASAALLLDAGAAGVLLAALPGG